MTCDTLGPRPLIPIVMSMLALSACATPDLDATFRDLGRLVDARLPGPVTWRTGGPEDAAVDARIQTILKNPLTAELASKVALLNNRELQARYADLGIAQADLVQAGLLQNPVLEVMLSPSSGSGTNIELGLMQNFVDLLMRPARQKIAKAEYESVRLELAAHLVSFMSEVQVAYYAYLGAQESHAVTAEIEETERDTADLSTAFYRAGNISEREHTEHLAAAADAMAERYQSEQDMRARRGALAGVLGLSPVGNWSAPSRLSPMPEQSIRLSGLEDRAVKERFDLAAHRSELHASLEEFGFEKDFRLVEEMGLAISGEREPDGEWLIGPTLEIPLPIFDQGQARVSAATLAVRGMRDRLLAEERQVRSDVILESEALSLSRTRATHLGAVVLPLREDVVRLTLAEYNYMLEGPFHLLEAQQETNETYRQYVIALTDYWIARVKLRAAIGGGAFEAKLGDVS